MTDPLARAELRAVLTQVSIEKLIDMVCSLADLAAANAMRAEHQAFANARLIEYLQAIEAAEKGRFDGFDRWLAVRIVAARQAQQQAMQ